MHRTLKIGLASGFGGFIGSFVALSLNQYFWWLGLIAGGLVGYFLFEFKHVMSVIRKTWGEMTGRSWQQFMARMKVVVLAMSLLVVPLYLVALISRHYYGLMPKDIGLAFMMYYLVMFFLNFIMLVVFDLEKIEIAPRAKEDAILHVGIILRYCNPVSVVFYLPIWTTLEIFKMIASAWKEIAPIIAPFIRAVLIQIHSECRLICLAYGALGTLTGYIFGSVLIGSVAGFIGGIATYEIVSKRILGLVQCRE